jgi:transglutaminase-like putative cysteine protease
MTHMNSADPLLFLHPCDVIDFRSADVSALAKRLATEDTIESARRCFTFVRDEILHSSDHQLNPVTCRASDVLRHRTGYCYAKSHLLAALLRANGIPAGLCYQRLSTGADEPPFCLHGLNAIHLPGIGWFRVDARGNCDGVVAEFDPPHERLAFSVTKPGEHDVPGVRARPLRSVVECLATNPTWDAVARNLPDEGIGRQDE